MTLPRVSPTLGAMTAFRADPTDLTSLAATIEQTEPFSDLADSARRVAIPRAPTASSGAIERFADRLVRDLTGLSTATGSLVRATRSAAGGYQEVDDAGRSLSTS